MSIVSALQHYLQSYPGMALCPLSAIFTDIAQALPSSYALAPAGGEAKRYVTGEVEYTNQYIFFALESAADQPDRADNYDFLESFQAWIEEQEEHGNYPVLPVPYTPRQIEAQTAQMYDVYDSGNALYQVQIKFTFAKEVIKYGRDS